MASFPQKPVVSASVHAVVACAAASFLCPGNTPVCTDHVCCSVPRLVGTRVVPASWPVWVMVFWAWLHKIVLDTGFHALGLAPGVESIAPGVTSV